MRPARKHAVLASSVAVLAVVVLIAGCIPGLPVGAGGGLVNACVLCFGSSSALTTTPEPKAEADTNTEAGAQAPAIPKPATPVPVPPSATQVPPAPVDGAETGSGAPEPDAPPAPETETPPESDPELMLRLREMEGLSLEPYPDVNGVEHICYGHQITVATCDKLLEADMEIAAETAERVVGEPTWSGLAECRKHVLIEMAYMLGDSRLRKFDDMLPALRAGDYDTAAAEIFLSRLRPPTRAVSLANAMREC